MLDTTPKPKYKTLMLKYPWYGYFGIFVFAPAFVFVVFGTMYKLSQDYLRNWEARGYNALGYMNVRSAEQAGGPFAFLGVPMDLSDHQWRQFREFIPFLLTGGMVFVALSHLVKNFLCKKSKIPLMIYYALFSFAFLLYLHGIAAIFPLCCALINYLISKTFRGHWLNVALTWLFNIAIKWTSDVYNGYKFGEFLGPQYAYLDQYRGVLNWATYYNVALTRFISYNVDYYRVLSGASMASHDAKVKQAQEANDYTVVDEHRVRFEQPRSKSDFNFFNYMAYVFYLPFYIGGPIISYSAFYSYIYDAPQKQYNLKAKLLYIARVIFYIFFLEFWLHYSYVNAFNEFGLWRPLAENRIAKAVGIPEMTSLQIVIMGINMVFFMWVKFMIIWRLFRFIGLMDDINPPENINRCLFNNMRVPEFWRSWHRSLHSWIIPYLYKMLGGSKNQIWNIWVVFVFIGLWHDLWLRWVAWAVLNCFFFTLDIISSILYKKYKLERFEKYNYWQVVLSFFTFLNVLIMITVNLAIIHGFGGTYVFMKQLLWDSQGNFLMMVIVSCGFAIGGQMMAAEREYEYHSGKARRY